MHQSITSLSAVPLPDLPDLAGTSPLVRLAAESVRFAASSDAPVLIVSESGFDPERVARLVHGAGQRAVLPFVRVDCSELPATVMHRLFGSSGRKDVDAPVTSESALALADGGTLFLFRIEELPAAAQSRLARLLRDGELRVNDVATTARFRVIASSHPALEREVQERRFRADLYRRLQRLRILLPPLRDRPEDVPLVLGGLLREVCAASGRTAQLAPAAVTALGALTWHGNVDQLRACLTRLVQRSVTGVVRQEDVLADLEPARADFGRRYATRSLREARRSFEREYIARVLEQHDWRMADAARVLGIERANLYRKTRQLGIVRPGATRQS